MTGIKVVHHQNIQYGCKTYKEQPSR